MPYGRKRRYGFRKSRGRYAYRPTAYRPKKVSWWRRRRSRWARKYPSNVFLHQRQLMKLTWSDNYALDASATGYTANVFRLNSLYDPQYSVGGGTPTGLAQATTLWARYKVMAAKVTCSFRATSTNDLLCGMTARSDQWTPPADPRAAQQTILELNSSHVTAPGQVTGNANYRTIKRFYRMKNILGRDYYDSENATALCNANPASAALLYVFTSSPNGSIVAASSSWLQIRITFYCKFFQNKVQVTD